MIKLYKIVLLTLLMTSLISPAFAGKESKSKSKINHHVDENKKYSIDFPVNWKPFSEYPLNDPDENFDLMLFSPPSSLSFTIWSDKKDKSSTLESVFADALEAFTEMKGEVTIGDLVVNGIPFKWLDVVLSEPDGSSIRLRLYYCISKTMQYQIAIGSDTKEFPSLMPKFETVINSFRFLK